MLPVQTVMIRYMVLVYRWGRGWSGAAGDWGGSLGGSMTGGAVTGGGARRGVPPPGCRYQTRARKGPADVGGGAFGISYSESSIGSEAPLILMSLLFSLSGGLSSKR